MSDRTYIAIDLKSFFASVECAERALDPMNTNLVVADASRTEKTICLAVSPSLKQYGIPGRARLFEVVEKVKQVNAQRKAKAPNRTFTGSSYLDSELKTSPALSLDYVVATPRMSYYMEYSTRIYNIYLKYVSPDDVHVYSIDEVFIDATDYLKNYGLSAREFTMKMILDVYHTTGITATAGIGTNLYLCKIALDIEAKHIQPDENGVRIAYLDEQSYREKLWNHTPITDFWRIGGGYSRRLAECGMTTMGDVARCSVNDEEILYKMFGIGAELLIDHAWGWEPCTIAQIKAYKPESTSLSSGQVLKCPYPHEKTRLIVREMTESLVLDLVEKELCTDLLVLQIGYDTVNIKSNPGYRGETTTDRYGRSIPKPAHGSARLDAHTSSTRIIVDAVMKLFDRIADKNMLSRYLNISADNLINEKDVKEREVCEQLDLFTDYEALEKARAEEKKALEQEKRLQKAMLGIRHKYGKNAIIKGMNLEEGATAIERNGQIGGHKS